MNGKVIVNNQVLLAWILTSIVCAEIQGIRKLKSHFVDIMRFHRPISYLFDEINLSVVCDFCKGALHSQLMTARYEWLCDMYNQRFCQTTCELTKIGFKEICSIRNYSLKSFFGKSILILMWLDANHFPSGNLHIW